MAPPSSGRGWKRAAPAAMLALACAVGCRPSGPRRPATSPEPIRLTNVAEEVGLRFTHLNGGDKPTDILRTTGSGLAWIDYDRDGWPDLFCVNGAPSDVRRDGAPKNVPPGAQRGHRLFRNLGNGRFADVTDRAGLRGVGQDGLGVAVGDADGDGWPDLYVTCYGPNHLYRNQGNGTFREVTAAAGVSGVRPGDPEPKWSTAAAWFDADADGDLDLYVANYCRFDRRSRRFCQVRGVLTTCSPTEYLPQAHQFFVNQGNGKFRLDPHRFALKERQHGRGLGVLPFDADDDGRSDLFVAHDGSGNFFFHQEGGNRFVECAYDRGLALDGAGADPAGMGVDVADFDGDGQLDLLLGNFQNQPDVLYQQQTRGIFRDVSTQMGIAGPARSTLTFGVGLVDLDLDSHPELLFINGHVQNNIDQIEPSVTAAQQPQLFRYQGGVFRDVSALAGPAFQARIIGRGSAYADYDRDGDEDVAVSVNGGAVELWRNDSRHGHWLQVALQGKRPNVEAIGSRVELSASGVRQVRQVVTGRSYLSDSERVLTFGLGESAKVDRLEVRWPNGARQEVPVTGIDRRLTVRQE